jgi:hypothetical protein
MADRCASRPAGLQAWLMPLTLAAAAWVPAAAFAQAGAVVPAVVSTPGGRGAQIYCFMRDSGNSHQVSWDAAYEVIKRQSSGLFRTSPQQAAVMITEAVVQGPDTFSNCGMYLGDLYRREETQASPQPGGEAMSRGDHYGY